MLTLQTALAAALPSRLSTLTASKVVVFEDLDLYYGNKMWRSAKNLCAYAGVAFLAPEGGPVMSKVGSGIRIINLCDVLLSFCTSGISYFYCCR